MTVSRRVLLGGLFLSGAARAEPWLSQGDPVAVGGIRLVTVHGDLQHPWCHAFLPDGGILVTERRGRMLLLRGGGAHPVEGVPAVFAQGQGGLFEVLPHPGFADNRVLYLTYASGDARGNRTRLARAILDGTTLRDVRPIFETDRAKPTAAHFGGRLVFLPDGTLLMSIGDGGNPPNRLDGRLIRENAQDGATLLGKVVRLNADGTVPADNPFVNRQGFKPEIFSLGHRNIQGLAWDPIRGAVWSTEHGSSGGDELNRLRAGGNFGWPAVSHSVEYSNGQQIGAGRSAPDMVDPALAWMTTAAPSGLAICTSERIPGWRGDAFAGSLRTGSLRRIRLDAAGVVQGEEAIRIGARVRDVRQGPDGLLHVLTDESRGARLIRIDPA